jgi:hypothetical protein
MVLDLEQNFYISFNKLLAEQAAQINKFVRFTVDCISPRAEDKLTFK